MGFDNECILNIQSLAGEYFCPVCRLLVYPNEALQSQCTHLYCKPCLTYIVGTTRACPYDGYLVTEADSKPLIESNKTLAETIGKIGVHCLYHRSGCQWQGPLSECTSHCSGCAFGNSPVVCNRCGIQIVHRQVQEHAQNCPGVQPQAPQADSVQDAAAASISTSASAEHTQTANQSVVSTSQAKTSQTVAAPSTGQDPNPQANANSQAQTAALAAVPTSEQWYQQQYHQYYQQYPGYDPYQQPYQNYYPYQQQAMQQYQQHPPQVLGPPQTQVYTQPQPQTDLQSIPQVQPQAQPQAPIQPYSQPQPAVQQHLQAPVAAQASVKPQQQLHPVVVQPPAQMQPQAHPPPHGHPHAQQQPHPHQPYPGAQSNPVPHIVQPYPQQNMLLTQYQQSHSQMQHSQPHIHPQPHSEVHPQHQALPQLPPQTHMKPPSQAQLPHPHPQLPPPPQINQHPTPNTQPQTQHLPSHAVTGHHSYPQPQSHQQMQMGAQRPPPIQSQSGPIHQHPVQMHGQFPPQPPQMRPPPSNVPLPNQQRPVLLPPQGQVPTQQQPIHPHAQQLGHPGDQHAIMQPLQQAMPQQHLQHQQSFPGQTSGPVQNQLHPHGPYPQQQPIQSQLRPQGPPHPAQQNSPYILSQQNVALSHGMPPHQSQNYAGRPMMPNHVAQSQLISQSPAGFASAAQVRPLGASQPPTKQNYLTRTNNQLHQHLSSQQQFDQSGLTLKPTGLDKSVADQNDGSPSKLTVQKEPNGLVSTSGLAVEVKHLKSETDVQKHIAGDEDNGRRFDMHDKDTDSELNAVGNASGEPSIKHIVKKEGNENRLQSSPGGKSVEIVAAEHRDDTDVPPRGDHSSANDNSLQQAESFKEQSGKLQKDAVDAASLVSGGTDKGSQAVPLAPAHIPDSSAPAQTPLTGRDHLQHGSQDRNLNQSQPTPQGPGVDEFRSFPSHGQVQGKGFMHPIHSFPPSHQQRPTGAAMLQSTLPSGPPHLVQVPGQPPNLNRPQGPGHLPQPGQPLNPPDQLQNPVLKQPHGSFHPEIASGGISGPSSASFGRIGPPGGNFESQPIAPQGHYNQGHVPPSHAGLSRMSQGESSGSFNSLGGMMGRAPPYGPEGQIGQHRPINPIRSEILSDQRSHPLDSQQPDSHLLGSSERRAPFGPTAGIESNMLRMNEAANTDPSSNFGLHNERFKHLTEEGLNHFPMESAWRNGRGEFEEDLNQFPRHPNLDTKPAAKFGSYHSSSMLNDREPHGLNYDSGLKLDPGAGGAPRFLAPYHPSGSNDVGDRARPVGPDGNNDRHDSIRTHPDFLGPVPLFGRHPMDREYHGFPTRDFGGRAGLPRNQSGLDDIEGRESRSFGEGPRSFNFPSDPVGNSFRESRFPLLPGHLQRGDRDGPGNVPDSDLIGQDILGHLRRGEYMGPRNLPGHLRFGEQAVFGPPGHVRMGDPAGPGNFPHPFGEPFGSNKSGHPRLGEPGFRSSYSLIGGRDPFDNSRKRKPASMGWCRICKVDCETVEGLDLHSQTREHQKMSMDMVMSIKQQNAKKLKLSNDHPSVEEPSKLRGSGYEVRGNKP